MSAARDAKGRPDAEALQRAHGKRVPDLIAPGLRVLFTGINPSLYSAAVGHHFARPGNRFWPALFRAGFTERLLCPSEERTLLEAGVGITNVVPRATGSADELELAEYARGALALARKVRRYRPRVIAFLGLGAYRIVSGERGARLGPQPKSFAGTRVWALPNPSGLNAHYQLDALARAYAELAGEVGLGSRRRP